MQQFWLGTLASLFRFLTHFAFINQVNKGTRAVVGLSFETQFVTDFEETVLKIPWRLLLLCLST